jgi:hypothetical protein
MIGRMLVLNQLGLDPQEAVSFQHPHDVIYIVEPATRSISTLAPTSSSSPGRGSPPQPVSHGNTHEGSSPVKQSTRPAAEADGGNRPMAARVQDRFVDRREAALAWCVLARTLLPPTARPAELRMFRGRQIWMLASQVRGYGTDSFRRVGHVVSQGRQRTGSAVCDRATGAAPPGPSAVHVGLAAFLVLCAGG